mgnify:FL=1
MKTIMITLALGLFLLGGCETRTFQYVTTIEKTLVYDVDQQGRFSESYTLYASDFNDELDLPDDATILGVYIEAFSVATSQLEGNEASSVRLTCYAGEDEDLFVENLEVPVELVFNYRPMSGLITAGVSNIRQDLEGFVVSSDPAAIAFRLEGNSAPDPGQRIHALIHIELTVTVGYEQESEFLASGL